MFVHLVCAGASGCESEALSPRTRVTGCLSHLMRRLGMESGSSSRAAHALN